jgi:hypothetical protein
VNALRRLFRMTTNETSTIATVDEPPAVSPRGHLHAARAVQQRHERELAAAQASIARAQAVIDAASEADAAATNAEKQAAKAARDWALRGALDDDGDESAVGAAVESRQIAQRLALKSQGAQAALPQLHHAEGAARMSLDSARSAVKQAITAVLLDESKDLFAELAEMRRRYGALMAEAAALSVLLSPRWGEAHGYRDALGPDLNFGGRVQALGVAVPADDHPLVRGHIDRLNGFARALLDDPAIEFQR